MNAPFRGNVEALLERERLLTAETQDLEAEIARLRLLARPEEPEDAHLPWPPLLLIGLCLIVQAYLVLNGGHARRTSVGPKVAPASKVSSHGL